MNAFKLILSICFTLVFSLGSYAQKTPKTQEIKLGFRDTTITFHVKNQVINKELSFNNDYSYYSKNTIQCTKGYINGMPLDGRYEVFNLNKKLIATGMYSNGMKTGKWIRYSDSNSIVSFYTYKKNTLHGKYETYTSEGQLTEKGSFKKGKLHGKIERLTPQDTSISYFIRGEEKYVTKFRKFILCNLGI